MYHLPTFGGVSGLLNLCAANKLQQVLLDYIPQQYADAWVCLQTPKHTKRTDAHDAAAKELADLFSSPNIFLPFRLPNVTEQLRESELTSHLLQATDLPLEELREDRIVDFVGNYFKPSALRSATQGKDQDTGIASFCTTASVDWPHPCLCELKALLPRFQELVAEVKQHPQFRTLLKGVNLQPKPYPAGYDYLLKAEYYAQMKLFPLSAPSVTKASKQELLDANRAALLLTSPAQTNRPFPALPAEEHKLLCSLGLEQLPSKRLTWHNRLSVSDPAGSLMSMPNTYGAEFVTNFVEAVLSSHSQQQDFDTAVLLWQESKQPILLCSARKVRRIQAIICSRLDIRVQLVALNLLPLFTQEEMSAHCRLTHWLHMFKAATESHGLSILFPDSERISGLLHPGHPISFLTVTANGPDGTNRLVTSVSDWHNSFAFEYDPLRLAEHVLGGTNQPTTRIVPDNHFRPKNVGHSLCVLLRRAVRNNTAGSSGATCVFYSLDVAQDFKNFGGPSISALLDQFKQQTPGYTIRCNGIVCSSLQHLSADWAHLSGGSALPNKVRYSSQVTFPPQPTENISHCNHPTNTPVFTASTNPTKITVVLGYTNSVITINTTSAVFTQLLSLRDSLMEFGAEDQEI